MSYNNPKARKVCEETHGPQPGPEYIVCHNNDDPRDNRPENVYWGTRYDNMVDAYENGTQHNRKLSDDDVRSIRTSSLSSRELADIYGVTSKTINNVKGWRTYGWVR